jgi:predicted RecB family nuclease
MSREVLLDAGVVSRCRRRVHLEHDPASRDVVLSPPDPASAQRIADATHHRLIVRDQLMSLAGEHSDWVSISRESSTRERVAQTEEALKNRVQFIWGGLLSADPDGHRRGGAELLILSDQGYLPLIVVRHRITDRGAGAVTSALADLSPRNATADPERKVRAQPRDQLRLAHLHRMLVSRGDADPSAAIGGAIGLDADVVLWHDLTAQTWPGGRSALDEYDARFADRVAIAQAAADERQALAVPSRILECRSCPWWTVCGPELANKRDVSLVVRGEPAMELRDAGISTVDKLAVVDAERETSVVSWSPKNYAEAAALAKAWLAELPMVRRVEQVTVPRADVEVDVDMESFGDSGAYLWGCLLTGADIGMRQGYHAFLTWDPLPTTDEARSFAEFWLWLTEVRKRTADAGLTFRAYCYNALAENRWLFGSVDRFADFPAMPDRAEIQSFVDSPEWVDLFLSVSDQFLCSHGKGLKVVAPVAGFHWRDSEASGEASMRWYREAVALDGGTPDLTQRERLLRYNEDDVRATQVLRYWMSNSAMTSIPFMNDL